MGASFPWTIKRIRDTLPRTVEVSCTLGDLPNLPGSVALAAYGASSLGVDYVKCSLAGVNQQREAVVLIKAAVKAVHEQNPSAKVAVVGFADAKLVNSLDASLVPNVAHAAGADVAMVDTAVKDGKNLLAFLTEKAIREFVEESHYFNLQAALAGSLKKGDLPKLLDSGADIIGVRGAACTGGDRQKGHVTRNKVKELVEIIRGTNKLPQGP